MIKKPVPCQGRDSPNNKGYPERNLFSKLKININNEQNNNKANKNIYFNTFTSDKGNHNSNNNVKLHIEICDNKPQRVIKIPKVEIILN